MPRGLLHFATVMAALAATFSGPLGAAPADDLGEARTLYAKGQLQPAMVRVEAHLLSQPREPQGRFLKGLVLAGQKRLPEAIGIFTSLTEDFPEFPEPWNNLAVLHAALGEFDMALSALELAIRTRPGYATAHENLGDIHVRLAARAYERALQLDKSNPTAGPKRSVLKTLSSEPGMTPGLATSPPSSKSP